MIQDVAFILAQAGHAGKRRGTTSSGPTQRPYYQSAVHAAAMKEAALPFGARILFEELVRACGRRLYTWVLQPELAERLGVSRRTLQRWESELVKAGMLTVARVSFWWRSRKGGVRRIAVPHVATGGALRCPDGVLDGEGRLVIDEERTVQKANCKRLESHARTIAPRVAHTRAASVSLLSKGDRERPSTPTPPTPKQLEWCRNAIRGGIDWMVQTARERLRSWKVGEAEVMRADA